MNAERRVRRPLRIQASMVMRQLDMACRLSASQRHTKMHEVSWRMAIDRSRCVKISMACSSIDLLARSAALRTHVDQARERSIRASVSLDSCLGLDFMLRTAAACSIAARSALAANQSLQKRASGDLSG